jgi:hypothetical protein
MRQKGNINQPPEKDFFEKDLVVFFLGPFYYLVLIIFLEIQFSTTTLLKAAHEKYGCWLAVLSFTSPCC